MFARLLACIWQGARAVFVPREVPDELALPPLAFPAKVFAGVVVALATAVLGLYASGTLEYAAPAMEDRASWWFVAFLLIAVYVADGATYIVADSESVDGNQQFNVSSASLLTYSAMGAFGVDWRLILAATIGRLLVDMRMPRAVGGVGGALINGGNIVLEMAAGGIVFHAVASEFHTWIAVVAMLFAYVVTSTILMTFGIGLNRPKPSREGFGEAFSSLVTENRRSIVTTTPMLGVAVYAVTAAPVAAIGLLGPVFMAYFSMRNAEDLSVATKRLVVDGLTGIGNRVLFWTEAKRRYERVGSAGSLAVMMIDIDNFKILNDTHGHMEGDRALCDAASAISNSVRAHDIAARYGGEEFGVLASRVSLDEAKIIAERILEACRTALEPWGTTVSIGLAMSGCEQVVDKPSERALVAIADTALYRAKHSGKNQVVVAGERDVANALANEATPVTDLQDKRPDRRGADDASVTELAA